MHENANGNNAFLNDIIKLQLKKPRGWNWELTTCKSSPNIALPTIRLFDSKGHLLVEAEDSGGKDHHRRSWSSQSVRKGRKRNSENRNEHRNIESHSDNDERGDIQYNTRTSRAGTLLFREISFNTHGKDPRRRRRRHGSKEKGTMLEEEEEETRLAKDWTFDEAAPPPPPPVKESAKRRAASNHVIVPRMGANVSQHSSKGLSGRRTQSSGSICKGRGKAGGSGSESQICGSLPTYLENGNTNHHNYERIPLNDVERLQAIGSHGAPLHWKFSDNQTVLCDQGYGSERSPEEEFPPALLPAGGHENQCNHHLDIHSCYPFINSESTFSVALAKGSRGLGLSVTGGIDSGGPWPGLIRIKRLFPHQPAASSGLLLVGDLILEANGVSLTGLTNYEALEVLRTSASNVELRICRPPPDVLNCVSPISEVPPPPPKREPSVVCNLSIADTFEDECNGEFEITMRKLHGSLGFTLRKEDDSALGHYIRALVRDPALSDGRIRPGDKIVAVNDAEISRMSHEEAVQFLRKCGEMVKLRLYRDAAQTPVATLSPTETNPRATSKKTQLRQEAMDMLNDIAVRKLMPSHEQDPSPLTSPARRFRFEALNSSPGSSSSPLQQCVSVEEQFHEGMLQSGGYLAVDEDSFNSLFIREEDDDDDDDDDDEDDDCDKPSRPSSLELYNPNQTPVACRKPKFNFSLAHNAYELNNLDADILDAPNISYTIGENRNGVEVEEESPKQPTSLPPISRDEEGFRHKHPSYQSASSLCANGNATTNGKESERKARKTKKVVPAEPKMLSLELNRGWNSRLGFSLQGHKGSTFVSAVHADSVAARDGRIKVGDRIIKVNDESVEHMATNEIIDLLRIVRGPVCIGLVRGGGHPHSDIKNVKK